MATEQIGGSIGRRRFLVGVGLVGSAALIGPLLAACGAPAAPTAAPTAAPAKPAESKPAEAAKPTAAPAAQAKPASGEKVKLIMYERPSGEATTKALLPDYLKAHPNVDVEVQVISGGDLPAYLPKILTLHASGDIGDIAWNGTYTDTFNQFAFKGVLLRLDDLIKSNSVDLGGWFSVAVEACKLDGKMYGLPRAAHPGPSTVGLNLNLFKDNGLKEPTDEWKWDDYVGAAQKLTKAGGTWGWVPDYSWYGTWVTVRAFDGDVLSPDGTKCTLDKPEAVKALKFVNDLITVQKAAPAPAQVSEGSDKVFMAGKIGMIQTIEGSIWGNWNALIKDKFSISMASFPRTPAGKYPSLMTVDHWTIPALSKHPNEAFDYLQWLCGKEMGVQKVLLGGGSPGGRTDVWEDPRLSALAGWPGRKKVMDNAMPFIPVPNFRGKEFRDAIDQELQAIWLGKVTPEEGAKKAAAAGQDVLDKPKV
jgi:multiple sugar transport system substrate-binding protein